MDTVSSASIARFLSDRAIDVRLPNDVEVAGQAPLAPGEHGHLSFASRADAATADSVRNTRSSLLLVMPQHKDLTPPASSVIVVDQPRREFARVVAEFFTDRPVTGIHPTAAISDGVAIGAQASIGPGAVVSEGCTIGKRVTIGANAVLLPRTSVGDDVVIGPGTVIGHTGFGYVREDDGTPILVPHHGGVVIGDRVEIGANSTIDRGTMADTVIEDDAKIDNLVHIAHNCVIGAGSYVIATAILCGGVRVGEGAWVAPNVSVLEHVSIGRDAVVGLSATVLRDVADGATAVGSPAREISR